VGDAEAPLPGPESAVNLVGSPRAAIFVESLGCTDVGLLIGEYDLE
jgi:hypothetical protein